MGQEKRYRQIWMFPRCKRRLIAVEIAMQLRAMIASHDVNGFSSQEQQDTFAKMLEANKLKSGGDQRDPNTGGPRTYKAQLRCLGLIANGPRGELRVTQAGEDLVNFTEMVNTLRRQVLRVQYPSEYSQSSNVNIDPSITIRPFVFLIRLAQDHQLNGLTDDDVMIAIAFGKNTKSFELCKKNIIASRAQGVEAIINDSGLLFSVKTRDRTLGQRLAEVRDIANTFTNVLIGSGLCERRTIGDVDRLFAREVNAQLIDHIDNHPLADFSKQDVCNASLQLGLRPGAIKDTRRSFIPAVKTKLWSIESDIVDKFLQETQPMSTAELQSFATSYSERSGTPLATVLEVIRPIAKDHRIYVNSHLIELASGKSNALKFEKTLCRVFSEEFNFVAQLTGQMKRKIKSVGGYSDIFLFQDADDRCGIVDAKAYDSKYGLSSGDYSKMLANYIPSVKELFPASRKLTLSFVAFVAARFSKGAESSAAFLNAQSGKPVVLCSVFGLNNLREDPAYMRNSLAITDRFSSAPVVII